MRYILLVIFLVSSSVAAEVQQECPRNPALPYYPQIARAARVEGTVELNVSVDGSGKATASAIKGHPMLVQPSFDVVERWTFAAGPKRSFKMNFVYRLAPDAKVDDNGSCTVSKIVIDFPNVEIWATNQVINVESQRKK